MFLVIQSASAIKPWVASLPSGEDLNRYCGLTCMAMLGLSLYGMNKYSNAVDKDVIHPYSFSGNINQDLAFALYLQSIVSAALILYAVNGRPFSAKKL